MTDVSDYYPYSGLNPAYTQYSTGKEHIFREAGVGWASVNIRSHARAITKGPFTDPIGRGAQRFAEKDIFQQNFKGAMSFGRRQILSRVHPWTWYKQPTTKVFNPSLIEGGNFLFLGRKPENNPWLGRQIGKILDHSPLSSKFKELGVLTRKSYITNSTEGNLTHIIDPSFLPRFSAANTWDAMARRDTGRIMSDTDRSHLFRYLDEANGNKIIPETGVNVGGGLADALRASGKDVGLTYKDAAMLTRMASNMPITGRMAGYYQGLRNGVSADGMTRNMLMDEVADNSPRAALGYYSGQADRMLLDAIKDNGGFFRGGVASASSALKEMAVPGMEKLAGKSTLALGTRALAATGVKVAAAVGELGLNPVMDVLAAYSTAKLVFTVGTAAVTGAIDAAGSVYKSFRGDINKISPMGMGYTPTQAATTSRARGVMAIQNSRLNARSVLGSEAGAIAAHFGY